MKNHSLKLCFILQVTLLLSCRQKSEYKCSSDICFERFIDFYSRKEGTPDIVYYRDSMYHPYVAMKLKGDYVVGRMGFGCEGNRIKTYQFIMPRSYMIGSGFIFKNHLDTSICPLFKLRQPNGTYEKYSLDKNDTKKFIKFRSYIDSVYKELPDWWAWEVKHKLELQWVNTEYYNLDSLPPAPKDL